MKTIAQTLSIALVLLAASFAVVGYEGKVDAFFENRWTARRDSYDKPLQYVLFSNPGPVDRVAVYERRHLGWPLRALYVDGPAGDGTWYAKLDIYRLAGNFAAVCIPALAVAIVLAFRRRRSESSADAAQIERTT